MNKKETKKEVEELDKALAAGSKRVEELKDEFGGSIKVKVEDVDYLEVEYLELPVIDLHRHFMIRICKPLGLVLDPKVIKTGILSHETTPILEILKLEALKRWCSGLPQDEVNTGDKKTDKILTKWRDISEVKLVELELKRK